MMLKVRRLIVFLGRVEIAPIIIHESVSGVVRNQFCPEAQRALDEGPVSTGDCPRWDRAKTRQRKHQRLLKQSNQRLLYFQIIVCGSLTDSVIKFTQCCCWEARMKVVSAFQLLFLLLENTFPTPIIPLPQPTTDASFPRDWCQLYPELDNAGTLQFLEDCNSTERWPELIFILAYTLIF